MSTLSYAVVTFCVCFVNELKLNSLNVVEEKEKSSSTLHMLRNAYKLIIQQYPAAITSYQNSFKLHHMKSQGKTCD